jgi:NhaA family Na+:H+ antiporter
MATDIAFALGVLLLLGERVPIGLKVFLTALAIVDDLGAILVIALFYTDRIALASLLAGAVLLVISALANRAGMRSPIAYYILGTLVWLAFLKSGVHATLATVLMAATIPARTRIEGEPLLNRLAELRSSLERAGLSQGRGLLTTDQHHLLQQAEQTLEHATAPLQRLEHALMPIVTFAVLPIFALANAGVVLSGDLTVALRHEVFLGVLLGLVIGKQVGILSFAWLSVRLGLAALPAGVGWRQIHAVGVLAGIGFTMSLFIDTLAFQDPALRDMAKLATLAASIASAVLGGWLLSRSQVR